MTYLGNTPTTQNFVSGTDYFNGTGSQTAFTLSRTVASINDIQVTVNNVVQQPNDAYTISGTTLTMTSAPSAGTNNVYVRYLSTTTQAITPSQNTVSWNTLDSNIQQDLGVMFKNRIINGNMVIDQRNAGASVTLGSGGSSFIVDRFRADAPVDQSMTFQQQTSVVPNGFSTSFKVTAGTGTTTATNQPILAQFIEGFNVADLKWGTANAKTVTLSFQVYSSITGTFGVCFENNAANRGYIASYTISSANTWTSASITIPGDTSGTWEITNQRGLAIFFDLGVGTSFSTSASSGWANLSGYRGLTGGAKLAANTGATWYITGVQLEVGTQATAFSTAGGSYGAELALCQRYYAKVGPATSGVYPAFGTAGGESSTAAFGVLTTPVTMRSTPTFSSNGTLTLYSNGFSNITSFGTPYYTTNTVAINITVSGGGLTAGRFYNILSNNDATSFVQFSSEL